MVKMRAVIEKEIALIMDEKMRSGTKFQQSFSHRPFQCTLLQRIGENSNVFV